MSVNAAGLLLLLFGWESIGLISFLLIGTFSSRSFTSSSAYSAIAFNRIGDVFLLILVSVVGIQLISLSNYHSSPSNSIIFGLILAMQFKSVSAITQLWLPEAMEGPTPVSSLLHSCTLVMAGIFSFTNFGFTASTGLIVAFGVSMFAVTLGSRMEIDFKRTIAFSTVILVGFI
ncbi:MAG: hypothetical protein JKY71_12415 [Alphaproteobacteria bacterium]|nr:hypothetical protein [Alphaproteobacteria bacterium]